MVPIKTRMIGKQGFFVSIAVFLLFAALFSQAMLLNQVKTAQSEDMSLFTAGKRMRYLEDDMISGSPIRSIGLKAKIIDEAGLKHLNLTGEVLFSAGMDYPQQMERYASFLENNYSKMIGAGILFTEFNSSCQVYPTGTKIRIAEDTLTILNDLSKIAAIDIRLRTSVSGVDLVSEAINIGSKKAVISVINESNQTVYERTLTFDPSMESSIDLDMSEDGSMKFLMGTFNGFPQATFQFQTGNRTELLHADIAWNGIEDPIIAIGGGLQLTLALSPITKKAPIIWFSE